MPTLSVLAVFVAKGPEEAKKLKSKLAEAAEKYRKDEGTLGWYIAQDREDPLKFSVYERYEGQKGVDVHMSNVYQPKFDPYIEPLLKSKQVEFLKEI